ncbi:Ig-like domain-containing protein [uncultured Tenacibaculum sp.]|uniref:Ig-like domain-containing protein n=1 Tax=uncultured Tenacibaculum sp. TaxID=174713 RepID=UPI00261CF552|nr:Ig-like domain-containing protein [uncultured Tenacibaculum sp.]
MKHYNFILLLLSFSFLLSSCARKGRPQGGPKDEDAPILVLAKPAYESLNFKDDNIRIYFDEYIVLKDLNKQLIVSPPFKNDPLITPQGTPSKYINIKILDSLRENTTYTFNFGNAVQDNNENNPLENFKYIFSTGDFIDSLSIAGSIKDITIKESKKNYSVLLYKIDSTYTDSIVYKNKPDYVTRTYDSINYKFTNIAEGKYFLMAVDEESPDYKFNPRTDKIGFFKDTLYLPKDSIKKKPMILFKEIQPYIFKRGKEVTKGKIQFGFTGKQENIEIKLTSKVPSDFVYRTSFEKDKDTINYWYYSKEKLDSLNFIISEKTSIDTATVSLRKKKMDSLSVSSNVKSVLHLNDTLILSTNNPIINVDKTKFSLENLTDSTDVDYELKTISNTELAVLFEKKMKRSYRLTALPKAIEDIFKVGSKDTLDYKFNTKDTEDYGSIILSVDKQVKAPVIIELLKDNKVFKKKILNSSGKIEFNLLVPDTYMIRAIIDENGNGIWDTGKYLEKRQPESIIYYPDELPELRANWISNLNFTVTKKGTE